MPTNPIIVWLLTYKYLIVYPLTTFQGPLLMLASGFLLRLGVFEFLPIYFLLLVGDFTGDVVWYFVGRRGAGPLLKKYGRFLNLTEENVTRFERLFRDNPIKILFISKITMGFGFALVTLTAAGAARIPLKKYLIVNLLGGFIWTGILVSAGYFLGQFYTMVDQGLRLAFILATSILILAALYGFGGFLRKKFIARTNG